MPPFIQKHLIYVAITSHYKLHLLRPLNMQQYKHVINGAYSADNLRLTTTGILSTLRMATHQAAGLTSDCRPTQLSNVARLRLSTLRMRGRLTRCEPGFCKCAVPTPGGGKRGHVCKHKKIYRSSRKIGKHPNMVETPTPRDSPASCQLDGVFSDRPLCSIFSHTRKKGVTLTMYFSRFISLKIVKQMISYVTF